MRNKNKIFIPLVNLDQKNQKLNDSLLIPDFFEKIMAEISVPSDSERSEDNRYVSSIYAKCLSILTYALNNYHHKNFSQKYWEILLGPWLKEYISTLYQRYKTLEILKSKYGVFYTFGLLKNSHVEIKDTIDFVGNLKTDIYNLQLYTRLIESTAFAEISKYISGDTNQFKKTKKRVNRRFFYWRIFFSLICARKKIIMYKPYFSKLIRLYFVFSSYGRVLEISDSFFPSSESFEGKYDINVRSKLKSNFKLDGETHFENSVSQLIIDDLPVCFIENYQQYFDFAEKLEKIFGNVGAFVSANGWYYNEFFKQICAFKSENAAKLIGIQHGGDYGNIRFNMSLDHELSITDQYYTWGWTFGPHIKQMPVNKLVGKKHFKLNKNPQCILYGLTVMPRFTNAASSLSPQYFMKYIKDQSFFVASLDKKSQGSLVVRPHHEDLGWNIKQRMEIAFPQIKFETWEIPLLKRLKTVSLYVCDHLSTTHVEALALRKPTILFWRPEYFPLLDSARPYYQALKEVGILFDNPLLAADAVNVAMVDLNGWWLEKTRQEAVSFFCEQYGSVSKGSPKIWLKELISLVDN